MWQDPFTPPDRPFLFGLRNWAENGPQERFSDRKITVNSLFRVFIVVRPKTPNEKIYSAKAAVRRLNRVAPQVKTEIIPGAGHDLTIVQADLVARKVVAFLGEPAPRAVEP